MGGLGDCLLAAASLQYLDKDCYFKTSPLLKPLFETHPNIIYKEDAYDPNSHLDINFKWVSQIHNKDLYPLHTMQRFSSQLGFYIDPIDVFTVYNSKGNRSINEPTRPTICINQFSNEPTRRYIPDEYLDMILDQYSNYEIIWIGSNSRESVTNIPEMVDHLLNCKLFIGPVSFCYHLASCLRTSSVLFTSYMPEHKFSHFFNTTAINPIAGADCRFHCERVNEQCEVGCKAHIYDKMSMLVNIQKAMYEVNCRTSL